MNRNLLLKLTFGGMFLTGALGIIYAVLYILVDKPSGVKVETAEHTLQQDNERTPLFANGGTIRHEEKKKEIHFRSTPRPTDESSFVLDVDENNDGQQNSVTPVFSESGAIESEIETGALILQIRKLEREYEDYTQQLEGVEEQRQEIFELVRIHDKTPDKISELVNRFTTDQTLNEDERLQIIEQLKRLSLGANSRADELDEMVRETREERNAIWAQRESVHAELKSLRSLVPAEVNHEK